MKQKQTLWLALVVGMLALAVLIACGPQSPTSQPTTASQATALPTVAVAAPTLAQGTPGPTITPDPNAVTTASGLQYVEVTKGSGPSPKTGEVVTVNYRGTLADGTEFDNSYTRGQPIKFSLGSGMVIPGWDEGIALMRVGGKAKLVIPPQLAYGESGAGDVIPPNATLIFEVELLGVKAGSPASPQQVGAADYQTTASGLKYYDIKVGEGAQPKGGQVLTVDYTAWLTNGTKFDSSIDRGDPITFTLGAGEVITGFDEGFSTMLVGGKRQLVIPSNLGFGAEGAGGVIPPNATLIFEVDLLGAK